MIKNVTLKSLFCEDCDENKMTSLIIALSEKHEVMVEAEEKGYELGVVPKCPDCSAQLSLMFKIEMEKDNALLSGYTRTQCDT